uniref:Fibrillar collagen NC1 domain-containing protein n=1 Tax=Oryzias latipes TaxID=8090 RepID=A0A3P9KUN4_ORYLA
MKGYQGSRGQKGIKGKRGSPGLPGEPGKPRLIQRQGPGSDSGLEPFPGFVLKAALNSTITSSIQKQSKRQDLHRRMTKRWSASNQTEDSLSRKLGSRDNPGTTCYQLKLQHPHLSDGYFYVDPNQGCPCDAVRVFCNFTAGGSTCIEPRPSQLTWKEENLKSRNVLQWFTQQRDGHQILYTVVDAVQLRFLRLHSHTSLQDVVLRCPANKSSCAAAENWNVRLRGDSGKEFDSHLTVVTRQVCEIHVSLNVQASSALDAGDVELLPVRDVGAEMTSEARAASEMDVFLGPLCFL